MVEQVKNHRNNTIGFIDKNIYYSTRDFNKNEIFKHPSYLNSMGISVSILKMLIKKGVKELSFLVSNYEKEDFNASISIKEFLEKSQEIEFKGSYNSDKQRILAMQFWTRRYINQSKL